MGVLDRRFVGLRYVPSVRTGSLKIAFGLPTTIKVDSLEREMSTRDEIDKAMGAHGQWKQKLRRAIDSGESESTPDKVRLDNNCSFGKWLYQRIDPAIKSTPQYSKVLDLHKQFHREAGAILELALNGDKEEAGNRMKLRSNFSIVSGQLISAMKEWQVQV